MSTRLIKSFFLLSLSLVVVACSFLPFAKQEDVNVVNPTTAIVEESNPQVDTSDSSSELSQITSPGEAEEILLDELPFVLETSGPSNFSAELTAPDVVLLKWNPVAGSDGYELSVSKNNIDWYPLASLPGDSDQFEDLLAPEDTLLSYRLVTLTEAGEGGVSSLQIQTQTRISNPLVVAANFDEDLGVTALIGPEGGVLSLTDSKGVAYSLEIPKNALLLEMEVSMTPVTTISDWPLDGNLLAGVHLEPDGWLLYEPAMLTITLPDASSNSLGLVGFGFNGSGEEFHLTSAYEDQNSVSYQQDDHTFFVRGSYQQSGQVIRLPVMELKGNGVGESSAQTAADLVKNNPPSNPSNANDQKAAAASAEEDDLAPLPSPTEMAKKIPEKLINQIYSAKDCYEFKKAAAAYQNWESRTFQQSRDNWSEGLLKLLSAKAIEVAKAAAKECVNAKEGQVPSSVPCAEKLIRDIQTGSTPFFQELQNSMKSTPGSLGKLLEAQKDLEKCPHSYKVNEAATLGMQWISGCIPSLDRSFQVIFKNPSGTSWYRLYPNGPFSGRVEGDGRLDMEGANMSYVYSGTYKVEVLNRDSNGKIKEMDILTSMKRTTVICTESECVSFDDEAESAERIPIMVSPTRCEIP